MPRFARQTTLVRKMKIKVFSGILWILSLHGSQKMLSEAEIFCRVGGFGYFSRVKSIALHSAECVFLFNYFPKVKYTLNPDRRSLRGRDEDSAIKSRNIKMSCWVLSGFPDPAATVDLH